MTNTRIDAIRARCEAATPGPWERHDTQDCAEIRALCEADGIYSPVALVNKTYNADFVAHSREDLPWALDLITAQQAELDRLTEAQRWIPVSERLPMEHETVLVFRGKVFGGATSFQFMPWGGVLWYGCGDEVTHWMPLPAPEKGESRA
jgi:hypothetical protein